MSLATHRRLTRLQRIERAIALAIPHRAFGLLGRNSPINADGDRLASEAAGVLRILNRLPGADFSDKPIEQAREQVEDEAAVFADTFAPFAVVEDLHIPSFAGSIPATRYRAHAGAPRGLIVFFHGGGWVLGSRAYIDSAVRFLAVHTGADVLSVDYRLAPEHPFPAAIDDGLAAWDFAVEHAAGWGIDPDRIVVAGDSAGGNISATLSQLLRGHAHPPRMQALLFPALDLSTEHPSYEEFADGYYLTRKKMRWFKDHYLAKPDDALDHRASPLLCDDLTGLPPAYIAVAGFDPLRDEGIAYAARLKEAGVPVTLHRAPGLIHAYIYVTALSPGARASTLHAAAAIVAALDAP
ncbi:alpha/beta hydrolase [Nocardia sp. NBC_00565]|uniref:alpha/beta hydrolase n=1 Tax=Nocardia sp. NBC_00565 TaxID=2975993 RepID=UPI002E820F9D|nr:alpha/beta hydrolase [Nocardia sp. NBC_00565]WUC03416.1 alpha/beta hydrolase [Nocardia sp. NBC_00565]